MKKWLLAMLLLLQSAVSKSEDLMLLQTYTNQNIDGWVISEKLDGVRGYWDGKQLITRNNVKLFSPDYFTKDFPPFAIDGELFSERNHFEEISSITRSMEDKGWYKLKLHVFDVPHAGGNLFERLSVLEHYLQSHPSAYIEIMPQILIQSHAHVMEFLKSVEAQKGEGVVLRNPNAPYENKRSSQILKLKTAYDEECEVVAHHKGKGQFENAMGAISCKNHRGTFRIGSGFNLKERINPPPVGSTISYKYRGLTKNGKPRFPTYWRERKEKGR
ncbi:DNA ligase [Pasteurellaceae bacterium LIM206]|nr:DNA ligase [Pasteurellaceae bacterium LIM206]